MLLKTEPNHFTHQKLLRPLSSVLLATEFEGVIRSSLPKQSDDSWPFLAIHCFEKARTLLLIDPEAVELRLNRKPKMICGRRRSQALHLSETRIVSGIVVRSVRSARVALSNRLGLVKAAQKIGQRCPESGVGKKRLLMQLSWLGSRSG